MKDYYRILGVPNTASTSDIKKAYRKRALELHPDKNKAEDAQERFVELVEAYEALKSTRRRAQYDRIKTTGGKRTTQTYTEAQRRAWREKVMRNAARGQSRGKKYSKESEKKLKRRWWWLQWVEGLGWLIEIIASVG